MSTPSQRPVAVWTVRSGLPYAYPASAECVQRGAVPKTWEGVPLLAALHRRWDGDAWFQAVTTNRRRWPRLAKPYLLEIEGRDDGRGAGLAFAVVDLDRPDHRGDPWATADEAAVAARALADRLDCSAYATRGGLRAVWALAEPVPLRLAQSFLDQLHGWLPSDLPVPVDRGVKDWTRGFRMPHVRRADGKAAAWDPSPPPMDVRRLEDGAVLQWAPAELHPERSLVPRKVVWPEPTTHASQVERRIEGLVRWWVGRIEGASSRHAVLLQAGRHVGGLCARYGVSPARFVEVLAAACNSNNARKTVQTAVDYGAQEPCELPSEPREAAREQVYARFL